MNGLDEIVNGGSRHSSLGRRNSRGSWRRSFSIRSHDAGDLSEQMLEDVDDSMIARFGDSGDRVAKDDRDRDGEKCDVENGFRSVSYRSNSSKRVSPVAEEIISPLPTDPRIDSAAKNQIQDAQGPSYEDKEYKLPQKVDYIFYMIHLAFFGILGVLTRYLLQKLFGPSLLSLTGDNTPLYLDLPSNMLGSFLMGWFGVVFKGELRHFSEHLQVGLSTGYLGSLTTFSGWNQKMLDLASKGHWAFAVGGVILGMLIVNESIRVGVESAETLHESISKKLGRLDQWRVDSLKRHAMVAAIVLLLLAPLWGLSGTLAGIKLNNATHGVVLWLGCLVAPPGVWTRWYLARLNGRGLGRRGSLKWLPIGTLSANIMAACLMAALATISKAVNTKRCAIIVSGVQFGFLGCMSTVSTFVAEVYAMRESGHSGRALVYVMATIVPSFAMGILIYSVPVWTKNYS